MILNTAHIVKALFSLHLNTVELVIGIKIFKSIGKH
jgi:hypothetical protein